MLWSQFQALKEVTEMTDIQLWPDWRIVREIGSGSFGKVYEINRQNGPYLERAALKVIRVPQSPAEMEQLRMDGLGEEDTESYLRRYVEDIRSEIGLMQQFVGYSNIVSYEDYLIQKRENAVGWDILIRMELLTALPEYMAAHPLSEKEVIRLGLDISQALVICHGAGIIHRDIKPQNIFVNRRGFFKLGDFGISRAMPGSGSVLSFKGSVPYMAPETFAMQNTDARSDIYSLALVLYRILNGGREPFLSSSKFTPLQREEAQRRRLSGETLPMPATGSKALCDVLAVALAADPAARYQSAADLHRALQRAAGGVQAGVPLQPSAGQKPGALGWSGGGAGASAQQTQKGWGQTTLDLHAMRQADGLSDGNRSGVINSDPARTQTDYYGTRPYSPDPGNQSGSGRRSRRNLSKGALAAVIAAGAAVLVLLISLALLIPSLKNHPGGNSGEESVQGEIGQDEQTDQNEQIENEGLKQEVDSGESGQDLQAAENSAGNLQASESSAEEQQGEWTETDEPQASEWSGEVTAGDGGGNSAASYTELVDYEVICQDPQGNILRSISENSGLKGHMVIVDAPEIRGYTPREDSLSITLSGAEEENVVIFVYDTKGNIPDSALHYNGHSYYAYVTSDVDSFWDAVSVCEDMGGYMAVINDADENRALYEYVFDRLGLESAYFGYTDEGSGGDWFWAGGDSSSYENWAQGQPDNLIHNGKTEDYALFYYRDGRYKWNDGDFGPDANGNVIFLIEWDW